MMTAAAMAEAIAKEMRVAMRAAEKVVLRMQATRWVRRQWRQ